jgi:hypothetical protein
VVSSRLPNDHGLGPHARRQRPRAKQLGLLLYSNHHGGGGGDGTGAAGVVYHDHGGGTAGQQETQTFADELQAFLAGADRPNRRWRRNDVKKKRRPPFGA